jgi:RNA polymerase sigma-70 factor, ECF subfamily
MDVAAAALSLGLPEGTVKARLSRGREILRGKLPHLLGTPRMEEARLRHETISTGCFLERGT